MNTNTDFTVQTAMGELTRGVIETVADRPDDSEARRFARQQTTAWTMMSFLPRDPLETMLAGHCVIFDHLLRDSARDTLRGQPEEIKLRACSGIHASGKMFLAHLDKLEHLQTRKADTLAFQPPVEEAAVEPMSARSPEPPGAAAAPAASAPATARTDPPAVAPEAQTAQPVPGPAAIQPAPLSVPRPVAQTTAPRSAAAEAAPASVQPSASRTTAPQSAAAQTAPLSVEPSASRTGAPESAAAQAASVLVQPSATRTAAAQPIAAQTAAQSAAVSVQGPAARPVPGSTPGPAIQPTAAPARGHAETPPDRPKSDLNPLSQAEFERELLLSQRDLAPQAG